MPDRLIQGRATAPLYSQFFSRKKIPLAKNSMLNMNSSDLNMNHLVFIQIYKI